jgi:hypothetical protein
MRWSLFAVALVAGCTFSVRPGDTPATTMTPDKDVDPTPPVNMPPVTPLDMSVPTALDMAPQRDLALAPPPLPEVGAACAKKKDCGGLDCIQHVGGLAFLGRDFPGGYCSQLCSDQNACPSGTVCRTIKGVSLCLVDCPPASCRQGYSCCESGSQPSCAPADSCD